MIHIVAQVHDAGKIQVLHSYVKVSKTPWFFFFSEYQVVKVSAGGSLAPFAPLISRES